MKFYFHPSANPNKIALMIYEADIKHEVVPINGTRGDQHTPEFRAVNPNGKIPAIDDEGTMVFDSAAILLYLAEKSGKFLPSRSDSSRGQLLSWLAWSVSGLAVYTGQFIHFRAFVSNAEHTYAFRRFEHEAKRHWQVLENHLAKNEFVVGGNYTIADMAMWGYVKMLPVVFGFQAWEDYPNIKRLSDWISARPAAASVAELGAKITADHPNHMDPEAVLHLFGYAQPGDLVFS